MRSRFGLAVGLITLLVAGCTSAGSTSTETSTASPSTPSDPALADAVMRVVNQGKQDMHLRAVLVQVTRDGEQIVSEAVGESMTGVPATADMHFRNGAVAISYMSTLLLRLVDEGKVSLDDRVSAWLPDMPHADEVTLGQLAQMTSGYVDYETTPELNAALYANPFRQWTPDELLAFAVNQPLYYTPGTNWNYAHTNYVILGQVLEKVTGLDLATALQRYVLVPLGLTNTGDNHGTPAVPEPVLHAFSSERRGTLKVPADVPFYEESTFWNPSWTLAQGAIQTTDLDDLSATAAGLYSGKLLSSKSYQRMIAPDLRGRTTAVDGCPACFVQSIGYTYGLGVVISGDWLLQNPLFYGTSAVGAYLPSEKVSVAVAVTYEPEAFDPTTGDYTNLADELWREVAATVVPDNPPPMK